MFFFSCYLDRIFSTNAQSKWDKTYIHTHTHYPLRTAKASALLNVNVVCAQKHILASARCPLLGLSQLHAFRLFFLFVVSQHPFGGKAKPKNVTVNFVSRKGAMQLSWGGKSGVPLETIFGVTKGIQTDVRRGGRTTGLATVFYVERVIYYM